MLASCSAIPLYNLYCFPDTNYVKVVEEGGSHLLRRIVKLLHVHLGLGCFSQKHF